MRRSAGSSNTLLPTSGALSAPSGAAAASSSLGARLRRRAPSGVVMSKLFLVFVLVAAGVRVFVIPHAVRSERWTRYEKENNEIFKEGGDPTAGDKIECPRWDGGSGEIFYPRGKWAVPDRARGGDEDARVFLYAVIASTAEATALARHFVDFYVRRGGIEAARVYVTLQTAVSGNPHTSALEGLMDEHGVHFDVWVGTFTSETKAWHRDALVQEHLDPRDWLVVADVDELHQFPGLLAHDGSRGAASPAAGVAPIAAFLSRAEAAGANFVTAQWEDRVAEGGVLAHVGALDAGDGATALEAQYPLRCSMTEWTKPTSGVAAFLPKAEAHKVVANRVYLRVHRSAHKVQRRAYLEAFLYRASFGFAFAGGRFAGVAGSRWPVAYGGEAHLDDADAAGAATSASVVSQHYKWIAGLAPYLDRRVKVYEKCGMLWSYESAAIVARLDEHRGRVCVTCGELACAHAAPKPRRRVAIITSVWDEHVDGVSITMNRIATFLNDRDAEDVLVLTPHDPAVPEPVMKGLDAIPKLVSTSVPVFQLIGRNDYVMGMHLMASQKDALIRFDPDIYHLVSPDLLGFSGLKWAAERGVCSVCTYHTQLDRYVRFYTKKHSLLDKLKPRLAVQKLYANFYGGCDIIAVPNEAIGDKIVLKMGIPRSKIGFFPRGVNTTQYNPKKRDPAFRQLHLGVKPAKREPGAAPRDDDVVVLWAARLVPEKGTALFTDALTRLFANATLRRDHGDILDRVRIVIVGSGSERDAMAAALPPDRTTFPGHLTGEELRTTYASSDIYFFPSHTEAFPNTLLEAQASGLAVLAPGYSVNLVLVPPGSGHLVSEHADAEEFADALFKLLADAAYRRTMARNAVAVAGNRTWAKAFDSLIDCYDRCKAIGKVRRR